MKPIYIRKDSGNFTRKIMIDMAYLVSHKKIRLPKVYFEENLYLPYYNKGQIQNYFLTKDKIIKEDEHHYFFNFTFLPEQVENTAI
jgi:hypothetical protein